MKLLAVDPSLRATGWAMFIDGVLVRAGVLELGGTPEEAIREMHKVVGEWSWDAAVVEFPRIYGHKGSKGADPNDLLWVAAAASVFMRPCWAGTRVVNPSDWKGQAKKEKTLRLVEHSLLPVELVVLRQLQTEFGYLAHNGVDAIGLGLYYLNRAGKKGTP